MDIINNDQYQQHSVDAQAPVQASATPSTTHSPAAQDFTIMIDVLNKLYGDLRMIQNLLMSSPDGIAEGMKMLNELTKDPINVGGTSYTGEGMADLGQIFEKAFDDFLHAPASDPFFQANPQIETERSSTTFQKKWAALPFQMAALFDKLQTEEASGDWDKQYKVNQMLQDALAPTGPLASYRSYLVSLLSASAQSEYNTTLPTLPPRVQGEDASELITDTLKTELFGLGEDTKLLQDFNALDPKGTDPSSPHSVAEEILKQEISKDNRYVELSSKESSFNMGIAQQWQLLKGFTGDQYMQDHQKWLQDVLTQSGPVLNNIAMLSDVSKDLTPGTKDPFAPYDPRISPYSNAVDGAQETALDAYEALLDETQ